MRVSKLKQGLARLLVICLLMCDTMPVLAQTETGAVTPQDSAVVMNVSDATEGDASAGNVTGGDASTGDVTTGDVTGGDASTGDVTTGDVTEGDASTGDVTTGDVTEGDASNGDVTPGDVTDGDVSTGDFEVGLAVEQAISQIDEGRPFTDVVESAVFSITDEKGNKQIFSAYSELWYENDLEVSIMSEYGYECDLQYDCPWDEESYTMYVSSTEDEGLSCEWSFCGVGMPFVEVGEEIEFTNWYAGQYYFRTDERGYYKLSVTEGAVRIEVRKQGTYQVEPGKDAYLIPSNYSGGVYGIRFFHYGSTNPEEVSKKFTITKVDLESLEEKEDSAIVMEYGTWGYSVVTGSANASGNNPVSSNNPIAKNFEITAKSKYNDAVAIQLDLTAGFEGNIERNICNYNNYTATDRTLWTAMEMTQRLTKADGSNAVTDEKGYLPKGEYKLTYIASNGTSVEVPFKVKGAEPVLPTSVELQPETLEVVVGDTGSFTASILPLDADTKTELTWTSSNSKVLEVENGYFVAKKAGTATVTVKTANGKKDTCKVTVEQGNSPYIIVLHPNVPGRSDYSIWGCNYGIEYILGDNGLERAGYELKGWNTKANGKGVSYDVDEKVKNLTTEYNGEFHLYAQWTANTYEIAFTSGVEGNTGVKGTMKNQKFTYDKVAVLSANKFQREGYVFAGWLDENGNLYSDKQQICNLTEENKKVVTLTAQWNPVEYKITYKNAEIGKNGVVQNANPATYFKGTDQIPLNNAERNGYEFGGWYTKASMKEADKVTVIDTSKGGNMTFYAKWIAKTTTVQFNANAPEGTEVTGTMKDLAVTYGKTKAFTKNAYKIEGYVFKGWYTKPDGTGFYFPDKLSIPSYLFNLADENNTVVLYADWDYVTYKITYVNAENGKNGVYNPNYNGFTIGTTSIELKNPTRDGYNFKGWYTKASMKEADKIEDNKLPIEKLGNIKIYAKWEAKKTTIHFNSNFPEGVNGTGTMKDLVATAGKTKTLTKNGFKAPGYTFTGWSNSDGSSMYVTENFQDKASLNDSFFWLYDEVTLYAQWELTEYPITYVNAVPGKNGVTANDNPTSFNMEDETFVLCNPERPGYEFGGWFTKASMKEADRITTVEIKDAKAIKIYAKWIAKKTTIHFESNRPQNAYVTLKMTGTMKDLAVTYGKTKSLSANKFKLTGYTFAGWNTKADGSGEFYANKAKIPASFVEGESITLYAQWTAMKYKISYPNATDGKDGVTNPNPAYYTSEHVTLDQMGMSGLHVLTLQDASKIGYSFEGWYLDKKLTKDFDCLSTINRKPVTLYAAWEANSYSIAFDANAVDAVGIMNNAFATYDESLYLSANRYVRAGYHFVGWSTVSKPGEDDIIYRNMAQVKNLTAEANGVVVLYAQWVEAN